ncbi:class III poly(R)-hydroxyalkanoic acid synthase subunit PhaC [Inmirania thermothiophila]|uniref:Poly(3-hydroxyalkanoate) polymerase subunit PhaC n=1 Tax=Inmirania thermothiophila TaxID=1750597 RepID=A0A3N1Y939_9GAMM|nr:class III poly(R)-hydroxyalkanoic acid synthase subunit PhaC [Inmirania thermothiophila]ROR35061.1 polyhydroxyalkanoate synthase [Inmirania thermothiophila]
MLPLDLRPERVAEELAGYQERLARGLGTLAAIGEIDVGASPRDAVYAEDKLVLYRYRPQVRRPHAVPLLIVYALVNRPYMADLQKGRSLVEGLLQAGIDVYLIDWGYPDRGDRYLTLADYIEGYLHRCVEEVCRRHELEAVNLLGICQGGTFSLCYAALHPERVRNLVTMVTPVDFAVPDFLLAHLVRHIDVDLLVDTLGNVPGELLNWLFLTLKPFRLTGQKYVGLVDLMDDPEQARNFLRMEKWIFDSPDQAGEAFRQFVKGCFQENRLVRGALEIGERVVELGRVTMPVLNIYATEDHLVPPASSVALERHVGTDDYTVQAFKGGHIGIYVSGRSQREVPPAIASWLKAR